MAYSTDGDPRDPNNYERWRLREARWLLFLCAVCGLGWWSDALRPWSPDNAVAFGALCWLLVATTVWWPWSPAARRRRARRGRPAPRFPDASGHWDARHRDDD